MTATALLFGLVRDRPGDAQSRAEPTGVSGVYRARDRYDFDAVGVRRPAFSVTA
jgi:hypothetical protein